MDISAKNINPMDLYNKRIITIWYNIKNSDLVLTKNPSEQNIIDFTKHLNQTIPLTEYDNGVNATLRFMYQHNRAAFFRYVHASGLNHMILLAGSGAIISELGIKDIVTIVWSKKTKEFTVAPANTISNTRRKYSKKLPALTTQDCARIIANTQHTSARKSFADAVTHEPRPSGVLLPGTNWADVEDD